MTYTIKRVQVEGLWGVKSFDASFRNDVNILIGQNGSNKTTFLSLIEASLLVDMQVLSTLPFTQIKFILTTPHKRDKTVWLEKASEEDWGTIRYHFPGRKTYVMNQHEDMENEFIHQNEYISLFRDRQDIVKETMKELINMSWLSIDRSNVEFEVRRPRRMNTAENKLSDLLSNLVTYRQMLLEQINKRTKMLNTEVLSLLLYDEKTDRVDKGSISKFSSMDPKIIQDQLIQVFEQIGMADTLYSRIAKHMHMLKKAIDRKDGLQLADVAPLLLISKTLRMLELSEQYKKDCDNIMEPLETYKEILHDFIRDKEFSFSEERGTLKITWAHDNEGKQLEVGLRPKNLSSGEKQLMILLTQALLQEKSPYIFIADEPELSLHIAWQKKIIGAINTINPNAQVIVATHSPEVAGQWNNNIITMESITHYEQR